jgi:hypothetical protein
MDVSVLVIFGSADARQSTSENTLVKTPSSCNDTSSYVGVSWMYMHAASSGSDIRLIREAIFLWLRDYPGLGLMYLYECYDVFWF